MLTDLQIQNKGIIPGAWVDDPDRSCIDMHLDLFFPEPSVGRQSATWCASVEDTRSVCFTCPVQIPCLDYATNMSDKYSNGIWGGVYFGGGSSANHIQRCATTLMVDAARCGVQLSYMAALERARQRLSSESVFI